MIHIIAKVTIQEEHISTYITLAQDLINKSQLEEGCIEYDLYQDIEDKTVLSFIEKWSSMEAIQAHGQTEHYLSILPKLGEFTIDSDVRLFKKA